MGRSWIPRATIHVDFYYRQYLTHACTPGYFTSLLITALVVLLPFWTSFSTGNFWERTADDFSIPDITYTNKLYAELMMQDPATENIEVFQTSTVKAVKDRQPNVLPAAIVKSQSVDLDRDGKVDEWKITLSVRNPKPGYVLNQSNVIVAFDYESTGEASFKTQALAYSQVYSSRGKSLAPNHVSAQGHLNLRQHVAIDQATMNSRDKSKEQSEIDWFNLLQFQQPNQVLNEYFRQEQVVEYKHFTQIDYSGAGDHPGNIEIEMIVKVPKMQNVTYVPGLFYVLKMAWCQYFCALIFWYFVLYRGFLAFLVQTQVFPASEVTDLNLSIVRDKI